MKTVACVRPKIARNWDYRSVSYPSPFQTRRTRLMSQASPFLQAAAKPPTTRHSLIQSIMSQIPFFAAVLSNWIFIHHNPNRNKQNQARTQTSSPCNVPDDLIVLHPIRVLPKTTELTKLSHTKSGHAQRSITHPSLLITNRALHQPSQT